MPIADPVDEPLLPSGISHFSINLNGPLAFIFKDDDGTDALHFIGEFSLTLGRHEGLALRSREAVVWIAHRDYQGCPYRHLQILLWRNAEIHEPAGTVTNGPVLFVTLNTFGEIKVNADNVAFQSSADSQAYRDGVRVRQAIAQGTLRGSDEDVLLRVFDPSGRAQQEEKVKPRPLIHVRSEGEMKTTEVEDGRQVLTVTGGVFLSRGVPGSGEYVEIRADSVVVFLPRSQAGSRAEKEGSTGLGAEERKPFGRDADIDRAAERADRRDSSDRPAFGGPAGFGDFEVEAAYLEGDVVMSQGLNMIRASRLYYDFLEDRALILDAVVHTTMMERNIPLYLRAAEIRQLSRSQYTATDAMLTTSEFYTPHYHVGASRVELTDLTPSDPTGRERGIRTGRFGIRHATLNVGGRPIAYWPYIQGNIDTSETAIQSVRTGFSDDFGLEFETDWHLFNVLGLETPDGFDATLSLDYFSERGPAIGVDVEYEREKYFGLLRGYLLSDDESDFLGQDRERPSQKDVRGRILLRHRQFLEDDWQLSLEVSYISDETFLEEFFESEFDNDKEQETLLYLKKQRDNRAFTILLQTRILDFFTQTERLPDLSLHVVGEPFGDRATWYSENRLGLVRFRPEDLSIKERFRNLVNGIPPTREEMDESGTVVRIDSRQEVTVAPIDLGPVRLVPFVSVRGTVWDDTPEDGGVARVFGTYGVRGSMYFSRVYPDVRSTLWDLDGVRHIIKPDIVAWVSHTNRDKRELFPFDETVEEIDEVDGVTIGVRQRWQTKRGEADNRRTVDFLTLDWELGLFNDAESDEITNGFTSFSRPENSISQNYVNTSLIYRVNDRTALLSELNYDINDGEVDILNVSLAVERSPRFSYLLGYRFIEESDSNLLGFDMNYQLTEKHTLALRERFDLARGRTLDFTIAFIRKFPRWFGALSFALDEAEDDFGISVSIWPEGLPQAALGSRRFTGLASTTRLSSD